MGSVTKDKSNSHSFLTTVPLRSAKTLFFLGTFLFLTAPQIARKIHANDIWKALYTGQYTLLFGQFPHHSTFTFSPTRTFLARDTFNWLGNILLYQSYSFTGIQGLQIIKIALILGSVCLLHSLIDYRTNFTIVLFMIFFVWGISQKFRLRTAIVAIPFTLLLFVVWHYALRRNRSYWIYFFPLLIGLWSNMHGSYLVGLGFLALIIAGDYLDWISGLKNSSWNRCIKLSAVFLISLLAVTFVKPSMDTKTLERAESLIPINSLTQASTDNIFSSQIYAQSKNKNRLSTLPLDSKQPKNSWYEPIQSFYKNLFFKEREWHADEHDLPVSQFHFWYVSWGLIFIPIAMGLLITHPYEFEWSVILPIFGAIVLGFGYLRTLPYIPLTVAPLMFSWIVSRKPQWLSTPQVVELISAIILITLVIYVGIYIFQGRISMLTGQVYAELGQGTVSKFNPAIPNYMLRELSEERSINSSNLGAYLIWRWWPFRKVFIDTKTRAYTEEFLKELGHRNPIGMADKLALDYALLEVIPLPGGRGYIQERFPNSKNWTLSKSTTGMMLFKRTDNSPDSIFERQ